MVTASATPPLLARQRALILGTLLVLAAACWVVVVRQAMDGGSMGASLTMGMGAPLFLATWVAMMAAMMFPASAPMILAFARVHAARREHGRPFVPVWIFAGAYLLVWTGAGVVAYLLATGADALADRSPWLMDHAAQIGGVLLILAGLYQLSPLKDRCLSQCRTPLSFIATSWREGRGGALRMGMEHGIYCLGCCWLLFALLFPLGVMNVAAMAALTVLIFAEKALPFGRPLASTVAVVLVLWGAAVIVWPAALPTMPGM
jgi:predicted metal-binding membrane protein